jgi:diguanylate cyclase
MSAALGISASVSWHSQIPCLLLIDLDHFKRINDSFGHMFGDQVLRAVGQILKDLTPAHAVAARIGGEEFAVLLPVSHLTNARALGEKIRTQVAATRIQRPGTPAAYASVTVSVGVTTFCRGETPTQFIDRADQALYASKKAGRDRVMVQAG